MRTTVTGTMYQGLEIVAGNARGVASKATIRGLLARGLVELIEGETMMLTERGQSTVERIRALGR